jgi:hypothetical protein
MQANARAKLTLALSGGCRPLTSTPYEETRISCERGEDHRGSEKFLLPDSLQVERDVAGCHFEKQQLDLDLIA